MRLETFSSRQLFRAHARDKTPTQPRSNKLTSSRLSLKLTIAPAGSKLVSIVASRVGRVPGNILRGIFRQYLLFQSSLHEISKYKQHRREVASVLFMLFYQFRNMFPTDAEYRVCQRSCSQIYGGFTQRVQNSYK